MKMITFTIIDRLSGWTYTVIGLQGIPKTDDRTEPEAETENHPQNELPVKEFTISKGDQRELVYTREAIRKSRFMAGQQWVK